MINGELPQPVSFSPHGSRESRGPDEKMSYCHSNIFLMSTIEFAISGELALQNSV